MQKFLDLLKKEDKDRLKEYKNIFLYDSDYIKKEDEIYRTLDDKERIKIELSRINKKLSEDSNLFFKYYRLSDEISTYIPIISISKNVIVSQIKAKIVTLDLLLGLQIGLYSAIPDLINKMEGVNIYGK